MDLLSTFLVVGGRMILMKNIFSILICLLILSPKALLSDVIYPKARFSDEIISLEYTGYLEIKINEFSVDKEVVKLNYDLINKNTDLLISASHELRIITTGPFFPENLFRLPKQLNLPPNEKKNIITFERFPFEKFGWTASRLKKIKEDLEFEYVVHAITYKDDEGTRTVDF